MHSDHVVDAEGGIFGLWNLAVLVADAPARRWPKLVGEHVSRCATPAPSVEELPEAQLRAQLVLRILEDASLPDASWFPSAPTLAGDLRQVLVLDFPDKVIMPSESELAARGDLDEWRAVGRGNLWQLMRTEPREHELLGERDGGQIHALIGDSVYTASMAMFLSELMSMVDQADSGRGVLVALPFRHQVAFRVIDGPESVPALQNLFVFAMAGYDEGARPLSPHVFWVKDGQWEQVTRRDADGAQIVVSAELAAALGVSDE